MAYDVRTQDDLALFWITGTFSTVNRLSEVMDDMPDGPAIYHLDADNDWTAGTGSEWYVATTTKPDDVADNISGWSKLTGTVDDNMGSLNADEWTYDTTNNRVYVRLSDSSDPNATDMRKHYAWDGGGAGPAFMTEHFEDKYYEINVPIQIGDGSTSTTLESEKEYIIITLDGDAHYDLMKRYSTFQLGLKDSNGYGYNGSFLNITANWTIDYLRVYLRYGAMKIYGSIVDADLQADGDDPCYLFSQYSDSFIEAVDSHFNGVSFRPSGGDATHLTDVQRCVFNAPFLSGVYNSSEWLETWNGVYILDDYNTNSAGTYDVFNAFIDGNITILVENVFLRFINPQFTMKVPAITGGTIANSYLSYRFTFDVIIQDENDNPLENVTVACEDQFGNAAFTSQLTDSNGEISQQQIENRRYVSYAETLTTYTPHKFTFSKENYETIVVDNFTVDDSIKWRFVMKAIRHPVSVWMDER